MTKLSVGNASAGAVASLVLMLAAAAPAWSATVDTRVEVLAASTALQQVVPAARTFTVTTAGTLELRAVDLATPAALTGLQVAVVRGGTRVAKLDAAGTVQFSATPGTYTVQVVGTAGATPGGFSVDVRPVGASTSLLAFSDSIERVPTAASSAVSELDDSFTVTQAGTYTVTITDHALPVALSDLSFVLLTQSSSIVDQRVGLTCSPTCTIGPLNLAAGTYDILGAVTAAGADRAGLYSIAVTGGPSSTTVYDKTLPVGQLPAAQPVTLGAAGGTLTLNDLTSPVALAALQARVVQGATLLATRDGAGTATLAAAQAGPAQLYVFARAGGTAGTGAYGVKIAQGATVFDDARTLPDGYSASGNIGGYRMQATVPTAGQHTLQLRDYAFPAGFTSLRALLVQEGALVGTQAVPGSSIFSLAAGRVTVLVFGAPPGGTSNALLGVTLTPTGGSASPLIEQTQGVGGLFRTRNVIIPSTGSYDLTLSDLQLPAAFSDLALALTQGSALKGQVFGGGKLTFDATAGSYSLNILARLGTGASYGAYGLEVASTPPAPVITLNATPASVSSGSASSLQWSTMDATACTASGAWTGARPVSGTEATASLTAPATYTLTCTGPGGSANKSVTVSITAASGGSDGGGGGAFDLLLLLLCAAALAGRLLQFSSDSRR